MNQDSDILGRYFGNTLERGKFTSRNTVRRLAGEQKEAVVVVLLESVLGGIRIIRREWREGP